MRANKMCAILSSEHEYNDLMPLTEKRPLSTLYFDCKYRILDFALSSAVNANVNSIFMVFNDNKTQSVFDHLGGGREWHLDSILSYFFIHTYQEKLRKKAEGKDYYDTTIGYLEKSKSEYTVIMGNKMLCNIDLRAVLKIHQVQDSEMTVVFKRVTQDKIHADDQVLTVAADGRLAGNQKFKAAPRNQELYNLSMDIFIVKTDWLIKELEKGQNEGAPASIQKFLTEKMSETATSTYEYTGYLSNIFDIKSYYDANRDMLDPKKFGSLLYSSQKVLTKTKNEVPTYFSENSTVHSSQFATGCIIEGTVKGSLISRRSLIKENAQVIDSIVMANSDIHEGAIIQNAILDKNVVVEAGVKIIGNPDKPVVVKKDSHIISDIYGGEA